MRRHRYLLSLSFAVASIAIIGVVVLTHPGCSTRPPVTGTIRHSDARNQRLMALAAEEAGAIKDVDARLTRQLNFADQQIKRGWPRDARVTLTGAAGTLTNEGKALNDHARLSGWVSVSELSRGAGDAEAGLRAVDQAVGELRKIADEAERCQYVMGLANELQYLKGPHDAAALLSEAGPWARQMDDVPERRRALMAFASALFNLDDFTPGQGVLRQDDDATWRSDMLLALATPQVDMGAHRAAEPREMDVSSGSLYWGKQLKFQDVFQGQSKSQTQEK
ncbi:MAG: hypothetical protein WD042_03840 [Phycisphaeraceae bacterium]